MGVSEIRVGDETFGVRQRGENKEPRERQEHHSVGK